MKKVTPKKSEANVKVNREAVIEVEHRDILIRWDTQRREEFTLTIGESNDERTYQLKLRSLQDLHDATGMALREIMLGADFATVKLAPKAGAS